MSGISKDKKSKLKYIPLVCAGLAFLSLIIILVIQFTVYYMSPYLLILLIFSAGIVIVVGTLLYFILNSIVSQAKIKEYHAGIIICSNCKANNALGNEFCAFCGDTILENPNRINDSID
ncbi:MAG: DUF2207 domain-containing protein [Asgard group archaeon]|nr:DUF2207 domain-containing protein [Asgard group archaeon]